MQNGQAPFNVSDIDPSFGSGGKNLAPNQGVPSVPAILKDLLARTMKAAADTTALQATVAADRVDGMLVVTLDTYTVWVWEAGSTATADSSHIEPTDTAAGSGVGRFVATQTTGSVDTVQRITTDIPLTTIQAQTSGVAFNVGSVLPANARLLGAEINVITALSGGSAASATAELQGGSDAAGSIIASTTVFTGAATPISTPGSNPYQSRGGQQIKMTITGDGTHALSTLTAGHLSVDLFVSVVA